MKKIALLLGRKQQVLDELGSKIENQNVQILTGTSLENVKSAFANHNIDVVITGAGIDLESRLEIIRFIFENSTSTTVHMKDWDSGPTGMLPFVNRVLND